MSTAAQRGAVDHVIVQKRRRMDELDEGGGLDVGIALVLAGSGRKQHQKRTQPLAAPGDDVLGDLIDQRHLALQARADDRIDRAQVGLD